MPDTVLENLSARKLSTLVSILLVIQLACFLIGGLQMPPPAGSLTSSTRICLDEEGTMKDLNKFYHPNTCKELKLNSEIMNELDPSKIVFVMSLPLNGYDFSRWQQNLIGVLSLELEHLSEDKFKPIVEITINAKLGYRNKWDDKNTWHYLAHSEETRVMDCQDDIPINNKKGYSYHCSPVPLLELGSLHHDYYIFNIRLPVDHGKNSNLDNVKDMHVQAIHMNGGFTIVWVSLKTFFFPLLITIMFWFWRRVSILNRTPALLEYMLISLAGGLAFLNLPLEYLTLYFDMPYMLLLNDIRQGLFYALLLSFWLVFAGEHMLIQDNTAKNSIKQYWKHLSAIAIGCASLLIFDLCERGIQLVNPFYSIWVTPIGTNLALTFIILAGISASMYFIFLCYMIWRAFRNISIKRSTLPSMSSARRLHYEGIIYRFNFLMLATVICAAVTVISFILNQVAEGRYKWDDNLEVEISSAFFAGVFGMWNVYICALLMLYAPSHKQWPIDVGCGDTGEEVEFSRLPTDSTPNEISSLTSFASKASLD